MDVYEFFKDVSPSNPNLAQDFIKFLKEKHDIDFEQLDETSQLLILTGFGVGYTAGMNFSIDIHISGPRDENNPVKFNATVLPHFFEGFLD